MDIRDLRYFCVAAETGHLGLAAQVLHLTQPAITKSIRRLEAEIGGRLFVPDGRRLQLTPAGKLMLERAQSVDQALRQAITDVRQEVEGFSGRLSLGASPLVAESLFPAIASAMRREAPGLILELSIKGSDALRADVLAGRVDMAVIPLQPPTPPELCVVPLLDDYLTVACAPGHPLLALPRIELADFCQFDWVLPSAHTLVRRRLDAIFLSNGHPVPKCRIEVNSVLGAPGLIWSSKLLGFTSRLSLHSSRFANRLQEIPHEQVQSARRIALIARQATLKDPIRSNAVNLIQSEAAAIFQDF
ncbi:MULTISPECIES: LysR family transcriptional regulator [unclassified Achromobacter]|uniref:LysR family transcriptional regulator n=1 Tax=unclassified Achromobacter TaxID=2626865 RepID=UPI000B519951|nr:MULTISPECIES: LysR family transcriptional regulator [unclassified Achromobacter]OWT67977.1 hypothetical protein CEY04_30410 [Achromobacter sp. HZ28]OWT81036.1 hypothetical protein CEY05_06720 [Achromobacter sp. HZ34]